MLPHMLLILLRRRRVADLTVFVVQLDEILDDGSAFPERDARVGVLQGGHTAVGVQAEEWLLLYCCEVEGLDLVWDVEGAEENEDFEGVGTLIVLVR